VFLEPKVLISLFKNNLTYKRAKGIEPKRYEIKGIKI